MPTVSVVIATYRRPAALLRAVRSALDQTLADIEVIVAVERDDVESLAALRDVADPRVRPVVNPVKRGPGVARDLAADAAASPLIAFLDDDDEWSRDKLEKQVTVAAADPRAIVTCLSRVVTAAGVFIRPGDPYVGQAPIDEWLFDRRDWLAGGQAMLQTSSLMVPKSLFAVARFGEVRHEEWELVIRAIKQHDYRLITVREPLVTYHAGNSYPWRGSLEWIESVRDLLSPRAFAGFCLTVAPQGLTADRSRAFATFLKLAVRGGAPTAKQIFAFALIWAVPDAWRLRLRAIGRRNAA